MSSRASKLAGARFGGGGHGPMGPCYGECEGLRGRDSMASNVVSFWGDFCRPRIPTPDHSKCVICCQSFFDIRARGPQNKSRINEG